MRFSVFKTSLALCFLAVHGAFAGLLTKEDIQDLGTFPESLKDIQTVFRVNIQVAALNVYSVPKVDDPTDAVYRSENINEFVYLKSKPIDLPKPLGQLLGAYNPNETLHPVTSPYYLIAQDKSGKNWLLIIEQSMDAVKIVPLATLGTHKPLDSIYWQWLSEGYYQASSKELRQFMSPLEENPFAPEK